MIFHTYSVYSLMGIRVLDSFTRSAKVYQVAYLDTGGSNYG
ncbi:hypothetical protein [Brevibacillus laterosporus]|nr:hypothetical protein [Brevibacillus laterosporus]